MVTLRIQTQVVVGIAGVPKERVGDSTARYAPGDHVARIQRQLGLKDRGAGHAGDADERVVRGDHDVGTRHPVTVGLHRQRRLAELLGLAVLENAAAGRGDRAGDTG